MKPIEVVCAVTVTVLAGLALIPLARHSRALGRVSTMAQCGKNIYQFLAAPDVMAGQGSRQSFMDSTDYFRQQLASRQATEGAGLTLFDISGGMVPECRSADQFASSNNAWTVLATSIDANKLPAVPMLVSRNLDISALAKYAVSDQSKAHTLPFVAPGAGQPKWGEWAVVVTAGGRVIIAADARKGFSLPADRCAKGKDRELSLKYLTP